MPPTSALAVATEFGGWRYIESIAVDSSSYDIVLFKDLRNLQHNAKSRLISHIQFTEELTMVTDWESCPAVERKPERVSGAWVFTGTRIPLVALYENLAGGATIDDFVEWFPGVNREQVRVVLEFEAQASRSVM